MTTDLAPRPAVPASRLPLLRPAADLDDAQLRVELANTHAVVGLTGLRAVPRDRAMLQTRLDELDAEYLRRFPAAAASWPWRR
ncbi:hypothetical protein Cme02nite_34610 [Catellatospora methionotrophica]|uniref:Uncharacterized protein n=1 Tax=Catellatospora methionotrophica TaxID=121620 RepID=A0A8J3LGJ0_9ACTN|nr:DUF6158 family protein [Catellatospora methionotrophica]GIG15129.1 hypothetical protein Cme02nite_34610 [Catellatospora methionotrophica]